MNRRILNGLLWCVGIYLAACILITVVAGALAGSQDAARAMTTGTKVGFKTLATSQIYLIPGVIVFAAICTWLQALPGTEIQRPTPPPAEPKPSPRRKYTY